MNFVQLCLEETTKRGGPSVVETVSNAFDPVGVTVIALLAESHHSIHSWPKRGYAAVDLFTCGTAANPQLACESLTEMLQAQTHQLQIAERGNKSNPKDRSFFLAH